MPMFNAHNWFIDRETAPTSVEADLTFIRTGAPAFGTVHMCGGMSRVQIAQFGTCDDTDVNVHKYYAVDPVGVASQAGIQKNVTYIYQPMVTVSWITGNGTGVAGGPIGTALNFGRAATVTVITLSALDLFGPLLDIGEQVYTADVDDIAYVVLPLPACWGFVTTYKTKSLGDSVSSNQLLKFS